ncbi:P-loop NTPase fold protein [Hymenobacter sp. HD11105]
MSTPDATTALNDSSELVTLTQRFVVQRRALRWCSALLVGIWVLLGTLFLLALMEAIPSWLHTHGSLFGLEAERVFLISLVLLGLGCLTGLAALYLLDEFNRTKQAFFRQSQRPPQVAYVSTPRGLADQPADQDALGFGILTKAICELLQHPATQAPYSLVLSGGWGSGKSSLMAQIRSALTTEGTRPAFQDLWFNVWHFQSEQHLLATFLGTILARCEAMPGFHRRLWWQRLRSQGFWEALRTAFVLALGLAGAGGFLYALLQTGLADGGRVAPAAALFGSANNPVDKTALLAFIAAWGGAAWGLLKTWQERTNLLAGLVPMERFRLEAARADAGYRRKYQQEFRLLMRATPPHTRFLIFIDDVDRIPGSRVLELLESINFISDTASQLEEERQGEARLYFVLGMYVPEVARTLGEALDAKSRLPEDQATRHAARYLAKLVDLVVPLPSLQNCTPDQLNHLLFGSEAPTRTPSMPPTTA